MTSNVRSSSTIVTEEELFSSSSSLRDGMLSEVVTVIGFPHGRMSESGCVAEEVEWLMVMSYGLWSMIFNLTMVNGPVVELVGGWWSIKIPHFSSRHFVTTLPAIS